MTNDYGNLKLHKVLLSAMKDIDKICRENGLKYFLYAGTLLGAVNYKGFIPWDDDVDISLLPNDFRILQELIQRDYSDKYFMETFDNTPKHFSKLNKLRIKNTSILYQSGDRENVFIDISILHNVPDNRFLQKRQRFTLELIDKVLAVKSGAIIPTSILAKLILQPFSRLKKETLGKRLDRIMEKYDGTKTKYYALMIHMLPNPYTGMNGYENDFVPCSICKKTRDIPFEDTSFMVYSDPEQDLVRRYGIDYGKPYPEEKRISKHGVIQYTIDGD